MAHIVVTRPLIENGLTGLSEDNQVTICDPPSGHARTEQELIEHSADADILISVVTDPITDRVLDACSQLDMIAQYGVGLDNVDLDAAETHDVVVTHTPGVLTDATADFTWALLLAVARHVRQADQYVRDNRFERWETTLLLGTGMTNKTMGIVGLGRIGAAVARRALGFGMNVLYHNRERGNPTVERQTGARYVDMETLLRTSDVVSLHCPLNEDSYHLIDRPALDAMKEDALLVNTARGPIVDEDALVTALRDGDIAGAALDVFEDEPDVHPGLSDLDNVVLAPHLASATREARLKMAHMCVASIQALLNGEDSIPHRVV